MSNRVFFPILVLVIAALLIAATLGGPDRIAGDLDDQSSSDGSLVARGDDLRALEAADGLSVEIFEGATGTTYARGRAYRSPRDGVGSAGVFLTLSPRQERALSGQTIRITAIARATGEDATDKFMLGYFTADSPGDSGWRIFDIANSFEAYSFIVVLPEKSGPPGLDFLGVWPDPDGLGRSLDIIQLSVEPVEPEIIVETAEQ